MGFLFVILCMIILSITLFRNVNTSGWLHEHITTDTLQVTEDGKYEYQLELINALQNNSYSRIYLKNVYIGEETRIPLDMPINKIKGLSIKESYYWTKLEPTSNIDTYILETTMEFPFPGERYEIDIKNGEAKKME